MSPSSPQSNLALTALRYLAGELDAVETRAFEHQLGVDDAARQALVQSVQVSAALLSGPAAGINVPAVRVTVERRPERTSRWSAAGALAGCALVAAIVLVALREDPESVSFVTSDEASPGATVSLWTQMDVGEIEAALDEPGAAALGGEGIEAVQVPEWMFAAIETEVAGNSPAAESPLEATDEET